MACLEKIVNVYKEEENDFIIEESLESVKTAALYMFYHYFNADVTKLDELNNLFCFLTGDVGDIIAVNNNYYEENTIDVITVLPSNIMTNLVELQFKKVFSNFLDKISKDVANIICRNIDDRNEHIISKLDEFDFNEETVYEITVLCNYPEAIENKLWYQKQASEYKGKNGRIRINILFEDDIEEEVHDVESPKDSVNKGILELIDSKNISFFGREKSFLCFISAASLRKNYYLYSTHGLFASNLRYYVKAAKIDSKITNTILNEPENFCYFNNGIIITCDDYSLSGKKIELRNFSIVNGGQTTNLIGRSDFEKDFAVMCKVIKNKYDNIEEKVEFLSKVAEASNTQKPIKAKDLIANRIEQRMLKIQFERAGMFLQVKRGEKIPKDVYSQAWQNASNDQVAQMLYSVIYQMPGAAKNSKSKLLENEKIYNTIFKAEYESALFKSMQHIRVGFNNWVKKIKKEERHGSTKLGLAKNGDLFTIAVTGLIYKVLSNKELSEKLFNYNLSEINTDNEEMRFILCQNDIGSLKFLNPYLINNMGKRTLNDFFEHIFDDVLIPAYDKFKKKYQNYSYANFVKSDLYYYNFILPIVIKYLSSHIKNYEYSNIFDLSKSSNVNLSKEDSFNEYKPGLEEELKEFRTRTYKSLGINAYEVFKNAQMAYIIKYKPRTLEDLKNYAGLSGYQIKNFGQNICDIVAKYVDIKDFLK